jgi:hypothetical protein
MKEGPKGMTQKLFEVIQLKMFSYWMKIINPQIREAQ